MKTKLLFLLSILIFASSSYSQNWKLLDENKTYFYKHIDSLYITNTLRIDSTNNSATDSIFIIHTTIKVCDTCSNIPWEAVGNVLYHLYQPEIFGYSPYYSVTNNHYNFDDNILEQNSQLSDSWIFNSISGVTATIVDTDEMNIFGNLDSIKIIELSTLDTIIISKNYGVIRYPDFDNAGKYFSLTGYHEGQNSFGEYLPNVWSIYDFNVGDIFCYESSHVLFDQQKLVYTQTKFEILQNLSTQDTVIYQIKVYTNTLTQYFGPPEDGWPSYGSAGIDIQIFKIANEPFLPENCYGTYTGDDANFTSMFLTTPLSQQCYSVGDDEFGFIDYLYSSYFGYMKRTRQFNFWGDSLCYLPMSLQPNSVLYGNETGLIINDYDCFESSDHDKLIGFIADGDTTGVIYDFPEDLGNEKLQHEKLTIFPNPANTEISIPENLQMISIYTITGDLVLQIENPAQQIYVGDLPAGIYFVHGFDVEGNRMETKLVVSH